LGLLKRPKPLSHPAPREEAARLVAIRAIVDLAENEDDYELMAEALMALGASHDEIRVATLGG
jgi:hypothetical protein